MSPVRPRAGTRPGRAVRPGGWLLVAFHIDGPEAAGATPPTSPEWFGAAVDLDVYFLDPVEVERDLAAADFAVSAITLREPGDAEYPSRRAYVLARQRGC